MNIPQILGLFVLSILLGLAFWQLIFKPLWSEYDAKMGISLEDEDMVAKELSELEAEIELDIKTESQKEKDNKKVVA